jgi:hypothetical protein
MGLHEAILGQVELDSAEACVVQAIIHVRAAIGYGITIAPKVLETLEAARAEVVRAHA